MTHQYDAFISHASEDKEEFVRPLVDALYSRGIDVWYDEFVLDYGDDLSHEIDRGLANSEAGIIVVSESYFEKNWSMYEFKALKNQEIEDNEIIVPIWYDIDRDTILEYSPPLADKYAIQAENNSISDIADSLENIINSSEAANTPIKNELLEKIDSPDNSSEDKVPIDKSGLMKTEEEIFSELGSTLSDRVQTYRREPTEIDYTSLNLYSRMMLYMVTKRLDFEENRKTESKITPKELEKEFGSHKIEVILFFDAADEFIDIASEYEYEGVPYHTNRWLWDNLSYEEFNEKEFEVTLNDINAAAKWAVNEEQSTPNSTKIQLDDAENYADWAREDYDQAREYESDNNQSAAQSSYDKTETSIVRITETLQYYPIMESEDDFWDNLAKYADGLYRCYKKNQMSGIDHHLSRIEQSIKDRQKLLN